MSHIIKPKVKTSRLQVISNQIKMNLANSKHLNQTTSVGKRAEAARSTTSSIEWTRRRLLSKTSTINPIRTRATVNSSRWATKPRKPRNQLGSRISSPESILPKLLVLQIYNLIRLGPTSLWLIDSYLRVN